MNPYIFTVVEFRPAILVGLAFLLAEAVHPGECSVSCQLPVVSAGVLISKGGQTCSRIVQTFLQDDEGDIVSSIGSVETPSLVGLSVSDHTPYIAPVPPPKALLTVDILNP